MRTAILRFLTFLREQRGSADNTILAYRTDLKQMDQVVSRGKGAQVTPPTLDREKMRRYVEWLSESGYRPATVARKMAAVLAVTAKSMPSAPRANGWKLVVAVVVTSGLPK